MRIVWLPVALRSRDSQIAYLADRNAWAAIDAGDAITETVEILADFPDAGRPGRVKGSRELPVAGTPYIIAYRVEPDAVVILRVLHGAQRWPVRS